MGTGKLSVISILSMMTLFACLGCQTFSKSLMASKRSTEQVVAAYSAPGGATGVARYYSSRYHGRKTTSGEIFSQKKMTAAHPSLPLGTRVKVVNLANNKSVIVKVNDRCLEHEDVFIDVSRRAADRLGFIKQGKADVRITIVEQEDSLL